MAREIVLRHDNSPAGQAFFKSVFEAGPVDGARVVEINPLALCQRKCRAIQIKIVQRDPRRFVSKRRLKFFREPGFSGTAATHNRDEQRSCLATLAVPLVET
jgi:hypothetical protein